MSTRGFITFVVDQCEKTAYNHSDSYPEWLGLSVLQAVSSELITPDAVRALRVVTDDDPVTDEDITRLRQYASPGVDADGLRDWYALLHGTQGSVPAILNAGVIEDAATFPQDSLSAEWGYVIDLDAMRFEVYHGRQKKPHGRGRFADRPGYEGYYPVALVACWNLLGGLPSESEFLNATTGTPAELPSADPSRR